MYIFNYKNQLLVVVGLCVCVCMCVAFFLLLIGGLQASPTDQQTWNLQKFTVCATKPPNNDENDDDDDDTLHQFFNDDVICSFIKRW